MSWPLSQDYNEAIQSPETSFSDPELKQGEVVCNALGIPMPRSGNFADVYEVRCTNGSRWAIKCFTRQVPGLRERYQEISFALQEARLPFTVEFTYLQEGIRIHGQWYPILKMQWVEGLTFNDFVRQNLDKPAMLEGLLQIWGRMAQRLRAAGIAHADLQHGNVLLVPGSTANAVAVKLIDYDGMFVPTLAGKPSGEVGHPSYQHPQRVREGIYSAEVDRFPLLLIAASLRCVRVGGRALWERYDNGDNLLFREEDLKTPDGSQLFRELEGLSDGKAKTLVGLVRQALAGPLDSVPLLEEALPELAAPTAAVKSARSAPSGVQPGVAAVAPIQAEPPQRAARIAAADPMAFDEPSTSRNRRKARKSSVPLWVWGAVAAGVLAMVGGVAGVAVYALSGKSDATKPDDNLQAKVEPRDKNTTGTTPKIPVKDPAVVTPKTPVKDPGKENPPKIKDPGKDPGKENPPKIIDNNPAVTTPKVPVKDPEKGKNWKVIDGVIYKPGLVAEMFPNEDLQNMASTSIDEFVAVNWGFGSPKGLPNDHFSVRWQGWLIAPKGNYKFYIHADDGARVFVDDKVLFDCWGQIGKHHANLELTEGPHHLRIEFHEVIGTAMMVFGWKSPTGEEAVPKEWLYHDETQVKDPLPNLAQNPGTDPADDVLRLRQVLTSPPRIGSFAVSADGKVGLSCSGSDDTIHLWNLETGAVRDLKTSYRKVSGLAFLPGNESFVFSANDGNLHFWDIEKTDVDTPENKWTALFNGVNLKGWKVHPADKAHWSIKSGSLVGEGPGGVLFTERDDYTDFRFRIEARLSPKANSGLFFRTAFGQSVPVGYEAEIYNGPSPNGIHTGSLYPIDNLNLSKEEKEKIIVRKMLIKPNEVFRQEVIARGNHIVIKVNGKTTVDFVDKTNSFRKGHLALQQNDPAGFVNIFKAEVLELPQDRNRSTRVLESGAPEGSASLVSDLAVTPDGNLALSTCGDLLRGWDMGTDQRLPGEWPKLTSSTFALRLAANGKYAVSYHHDHWGTVWNVAEGKSFMTFGDPQEGGNLRAIAIAADGKLVVTGAVDGRIQLHDPETKRVAFRELPSLGVPVKALALSPDGHYLVAAGESRTRHFLVVFDLASGKEVQRLENTPVKSNMLKFAGNASCLVASDDTGRVRVFDLADKPGATSQQKTPMPKWDENPRVTPEYVNALQPQPLPIDPSWSEEGRLAKTWLSDLQEFDTVVGFGKFGKAGLLGYPYRDRNGNDPIQVQNKRFPHALSFVPKNDFYGRVRYKLEGRMKLLCGQAATADPVQLTEQEKAVVGPVTFAIYGDGRLLWKSNPIKGYGQSEPFELSVQDVQILELRTLCPGPNSCTRPVWLEPYVLGDPPGPGN